MTMRTNFEKMTKRNRRNEENLDVISNKEERRTARKFKQRNKWGE